MPTATSGASRRGEEPPEQRQTGLCSMQRPVILLSGLPPDLPDGFIRRAYRPSDRSALPTALPEALTGRVTWVILTGPPYRRVSSARLFDLQTARLFRTPDRPALPAALPTASPAASPASYTSQPHRPARPTQPANPTGQPHQPARPTSPTDQPDQQPHRPSTPATLDQPSTPAKVPPAGLTGRLRSAGRRLRGWRSSRHG